MKNDQKHFKEILSDFDNAMLTTLGRDQRPSARPMRIADMTDEGEIWFATDKMSEKVHEIEANPIVGITLQSERRFLSLTGSATLVGDRTKIKELWSEAWKVWFPGGEDDPTLALLKVKPMSGEFWDLSGTNRLRYLYEAGKAYFQGTTIDDDALAEVSAKVDF